MKSCGREGWQSEKPLSLLHLLILLELSELWCGSLMEPTVVRSMPSLATVDGTFPALSALEIRGEAEGFTPLTPQLTFL